MPTTRMPWGTHDGVPVERVEITNAGGLRCGATNFGAALISLYAPDSKGRVDDILLGYDTLAGYVSDRCYLGCVAGRCANRIGGGAFMLNGTQIELTRNDGPHHLHGGPRGFGRRAWAIDSVDARSIRMRLSSAHGDEGYPGALDATVTYTLRDDDTLVTEFEATTDAPTLCNLAQHAYWNLGGHTSGSIASHEIEVHANTYLPVDDTTLPTGAIADVRGTPFDLRTRDSLGKRIEQLGDARGFDHHFVVSGIGLRPFVRIAHPESGRILELSSDQPGVQLYVGGFLDGVAGKEGTRYEQHAGLCLESQIHPDAIHHPDWPSPMLRPGERYRHVMETRLRTR